MDQNTTSHRDNDALDTLVRTTGDSPMGQLLRRFWHPVALSRKLAVGEAKGIRILSEDLTLYRGDSGRAYLVGGRCAHRLTNLHTGWVEGEFIRCMYHGWQYDGSGLCVQMPAEINVRATAKIVSYPIREYCGLIFAYMGPEPAPQFELPRKQAFERENVIAFTRQEPWKCNWFQQVENSLDAVHVSFVHQWGRVGQFGQAITASIPKLEYSETFAGLRQTATRSEDNVRISDWTFPNCNHIVVPGIDRECPWIDVGHWVVPNDDETTTRFIIYVTPTTNAIVDKRITDYFEQVAEYNPADHHDDLIHRKIVPEDPLLCLTSAQDYVAAMGQGTIANREDERLAGSDAGVALLRRVFLREIDALKSGRPPKVWKPLESAQHLPQRTSPAG